MESVRRELLKALLIAAALHGVFCVAIPLTILRLTSGLVLPPPSAVTVLGVAIVGAGFMLYLRVVWELVVLAGVSASPLAAPTHLRTEGLYAWSRNPLLFGVVLMLFGEAVVFGSVPLAIYAAAYWTWLHLFLVFKEEPALQAQFGDTYRAYCLRVPRWFLPPGTAGGPPAVCGAG